MNITAERIQNKSLKVRPHRTRSAAADRDRSPLRQTAFCVAGPLGYLGSARRHAFELTQSSRVLEKLMVRT